MRKPDELKLRSILNNSRKKNLRPSKAIKSKQTVRNKPEEPKKTSDVIFWNLERSSP